MSWLVVNKDFNQKETDGPVPPFSQAPLVTIEQRAGTFILVDRDGGIRPFPTLSFMI